MRIRKTAWDSESGTRVAEVGAQFQIYLTEKGSYDKCSDDERDVITIGESGEEILSCFGTEITQFIRFLPGSLIQKW